MYKLAKFTAAMLLASVCGISAAQQARTFDGVGRMATPKEITAWDIDVRPDFKGLPKGSGSVQDGMDIWDNKCASCHGTFGESNEVFTPLVGGTTAKDQKTGRVASLTDPKQPQRTTLMKVPTVSTLWDYIHRAMPWNEPRSLSVDDTYAVVAYMLSLGEIVPDDYTLSDANIAQVQAKMPNRNGMTTDHGLWTVDGKPDVQGTLCMSNCVAEVVITSSLPDFARNAHENLLEQNRIFGPYRGVDTTKPPVAALPGASYQLASLPAATAAVDPKVLFTKNNCAACHAAANRVVGPSIKDVADKYRGQTEALVMLNGKVKNGAVGAWGQIPMPPHAHISDDDISVMVRWMVTGS
jgi:cytochrome c551/c552